MHRAGTLRALSDAEAPAPTPQLFVETLVAYQKTAAIVAAVELDLFSAIGAGHNSVSSLALRTGADPRGIRILCDYLTVLGFLRKESTEYYQTDATAIFLDGSSSRNMSHIVKYLAAPELLQMYLGDPASYVRNGGTKSLATLAPEHPIWVTFARSKEAFPSLAAEATAAYVNAWHVAPRNVLDIASGCGTFGIAIAKRVAAARVVGVDWRNVVAVAQENASRANLGSRYVTLAGDVFTVDWGVNYDLVLLPNILHHFDHTMCVMLLRKVRASLASGGRVLAIEFVPNEDRISPPIPATLAFMMLATTQRGDAFTFAEYDEMGRDAGYRSASIATLPPSEESLIEFHA